VQFLPRDPQHVYLGDFFLDFVLDGELFGAVGGQQPPVFLDFESLQDDLGIDLHRHQVLLDLLVLQTVPVL
jgi:hypothetical protein